ncbi:peptidase C25 gingipain [Thioploca ingrica]|uniref:Peptidase C25 gingipain n=1 Tax=Thioploca ingrica TaxID=40754 RepID=A0A090BVZ3_9GAMM|nr:peptidase C25 gingipain [Thioploca ingrica]
MITHWGKRTLSPTHFSLLLFAIILFNLSWLPSALATTDCTAVTEIPPTECEILINFYNSTNGPNWSDNASNNWNVTNTPCSWAGISCSSPANPAGVHIIGIDRGEQNLSGSFPDLSSLTSLRLLDLSSGQLSGPFPTWLSSLTALQFLDLNQNQLTGDIPNLSNLTNLQLLWLEGNQLTSGPIPEWICQLSSLLSLNLSNSQRTGSIPNCINNLTKLEKLYLDDNQLSGSIPDLAALTHLQVLSCYGNQLTGSIPNLSTLTQLQELYLHSNHLTGSIPNLSPLTQLQQINLDINQLTGSIPDEIGTLTQLQHFSLHSNQFTGSIPTSLINLTNLNYLELSFNRLTAQDNALLTFLNSKNPTWAQTQTVTPLDVLATPSSATSIQISWTPILYTNDGGYYWVQYATTPGGPYTPATSATPDKNATSYVVTGLSPNTTYYFVVQTYTPTHGFQQNNLTSDLSAEVSATTTDSTAPPPLPPPVTPPAVTPPPATPPSATPLSLNITTVGQGKVISTPAGIDCGNQCQAGFATNTQVTLTATPATNWRFEQWQGDCDPNGLVIIDKDKQCEAVFVKINFDAQWLPLDMTNLAASGIPPKIATPSSNLQGMTININVPGMDVIDKVASDGNLYQQLNIPKEGLTTEEGKPQVPMLSQFIAIPVGAQVKVEMLEPSYDELTGYWVYPAQPPAADLEDAPPPPFTIDKEFYARDEFYPAKVVNLEGPEVIRGQSVVILRLFPVQFNPAKQTLRIYSKIRLRVSFQGGKNYFIENPRLRSSAFEPIFNKLLLNAPAVAAFSAVPLAEAAYEQGNSLLIITPPKFFEAANTLAKWKIKKGIETIVKTTVETGNTADQIRNFIQTAYNNWNPPPTYVLLIGDAEFISPYYKTWHPYNSYCGGCEGYIGTDLYYATVDGDDYFPDISLGRLSVDTLAEAKRRVNNIIGYESNPVAGSAFYQNVALATYFQDCNYPPCQGGNDGHANNRFTQTIEDIAIYLSAPNYLNQYQVDRIYVTDPAINPTHWNDDWWNFGGGPAGDPDDSIPNYLRRDSGFPWNGNAQQITTKINEGRFLVIHRDHGTPGGWVSPQYTTSDVQALTNGNKLPVVWSINCQTGWFDNETDNSGTNNNALPIYFSEAWERNPNGGAVGIIAATRVSYSGYNDQLTWGLMDAIWPDFVKLYTATHTPFDKPMWEMGSVLNYGKYYLASQYGESDTRKTTFEIFHWFGDPTMPIWTSEPQPFNNVSHEALISAGTQFINVGVNVPDALISITRENSGNGEILGRKLSTGGITTIPLSKPMLATDIVHVTITKQNYRPYEGTIITDPCLVITVRSNESGNGSSVNTWARQVGDEWIVGTKLKVNDKVLIQANHTIETNSIKVKTLCIKAGGVLKNNQGSLKVQAEHIYNAGDILGAEGTNGYIPDGLETLPENYLHAKNGGNVVINASESITNIGKIKAGRGGNDITHNFFTGNSMSAKGGKGGSISINSKFITNEGIIGPEVAPTYNNKQWLSDGGNGGVGSNAYQIELECNGKQPGGSVNSDQYLLGIDGWNNGNAVGGNGGNTTINATNQLINHGMISSGYGGDARVWSKNAKSCAYLATKGKGGNNVMTAPNLENSGVVRAGGDGKAISEPEMMLSGNNMRYEDSQAVVIFGGDNQQLSLRQLSADAITATETITLAAGQGGTVDLRDNNASILNAPTVRIFSDSILLEPEKNLQNLTTPNSRIETYPANILHEVALSSSGTLIGTPVTNQTIDVEILNAGPTADTYTLTVTDPQGWSINTLPATVTLNGLERVELSLQVILSATVGAEDTITITATSQSDPNITATTETTLLVVSEAELPPEPEELEAMVTIDPTQMNQCPTQGVVNRVCDAQGQVITNLVTDPNASIAHGTLIGTLNNNGLVSNLTIEPSGLLIGGTVSGFIHNQGQMMDFDFVGAEIQGGTLAGTIHNRSLIGGTFKDVNFAPNTHLTGGRLQGNLSGDANAPALLEHLTIQAHSQLAHVTMGENVVLAEGVTLGEGVNFINPGDDPRNLKSEEVIPPPACNTDLPLLGTTAVNLQGKPLDTLTQTSGGIAINQGAFQQQVTQKLTDSVTVKGQLCPDPDHVGQAAELIVYAEYRPLNSPESKSHYYMLDDQDQILPWDDDLANLVTFRKVVLKAAQTVSIYQGQFPAAGLLNIYFGYRLPTSGLLSLNRDAITVKIGE